MHTQWHIKQGRKSLFCILLNNAEQKHAEQKNKLAIPRSECDAHTGATQVLIPSSKTSTSPAAVWT